MGLRVNVGVRPFLDGEPIARRGWMRVTMERNSANDGSVWIAEKGNGRRSVLAIDDAFLAASDSVMDIASMLDLLERTPERTREDDAEGRPPHTVADVPQREVTP